jgi:hypothetical protein
VNLCPVDQFSQSPLPKRVSTTAVDMKTTQHRIPTDEFHVSQHLDNLDTVSERRQNGVNAAEFQFKSTPHVCCPF